MVTLWVGQSPHISTEYTILRIGTVQDARTLLPEYLSFDEHLPLCLDMKDASAGSQEAVLKFVEEYTGCLWILVDEPVIPTLLSRSNQIKKHPLIFPQKSFLLHRLIQIDPKRGERFLSLQERLS